MSNEVRRVYFKRKYGFRVQRFCHVFDLSVRSSSDSVLRVSTVPGALKALRLGKPVQFVAVCMPDVDIQGVVCRA